MYKIIISDVYKVINSDLFNVTLIITLINLN